MARGGAIPQRRELPRSIGREDASIERWLHIFAASVREVLETEPLKLISGRRLSLSQFHLLRLASAVGLNHAGVAARFLGVSRPALTKATDKLVRLGLLTRTPSKTDRRALILRATRRGRALVARHERLRSSRLDGALRSLPLEDLEHLVGLLRSVSLALLHRGDLQEGDCLRCAGHVLEGCSVAHLRGGCPYHVMRTQGVDRSAR